MTVAQLDILARADIELQGGSDAPQETGNATAADAIWLSNMAARSA